MSRAGLWLSLSSCCSRQWPSLATEVTRWQWHSGTEEAFLTKPETTHSSPGFTLPRTLETWQCLTKQLKKPNGTGPKRGLDWRVSWTETSCSKFVGVRKSRHFCGLNHASESYWSLPASADHWGLGLKARLGFWDSCFCLRSTCSLCLVHIKLSVRSYQGLPSLSLTSRSQSVIS